MWKPFFILFILATNFCTLLDSYKITNNNKSSKTVQSYDQQDSSNQQEEYIEGNYSNEDSNNEFNGRVVIGKWRNNGEALEPKWRDGDSVPLAPFSAISLKNGWRKDADSREEDYRQIIEPENFNENAKKHLQVSLTDENSRRKEKQFDGTNFDEGNGSYFHRSRTSVSSISGTLRESLRNGDVHGSGKYRETLADYPSEHELFENENDDPRPRKRRPPEHHEFPGSYGGGKQEEKIKTETSNVQGNDIRRYSMPNNNPMLKPTNHTRSQENVELKTYLKMQGNNLSLSEILQQKNLTLADLLRGKPNAINILKSDDKKHESVQDEGETMIKKSTFTTTTTEKSLSDPVTFGNTRWSERRRIMLRISNKNSTKSEANLNLNVNQTNVNFVTTTLPPVVGTKSTNKTKEIESDEISEEIDDLFDAEKNESDSREFLKPLENRESLATEATTLVEDGTEYSLNDHDASVSDEDRYTNGNNNDEDEIMEFSDYPASKLPKFVGPIIYDTAVLNKRRKMIPFSAIRSKNPIESPDLKLNMKNISKINETSDMNEAVDKIKNKTEIIKLSEKLETSRKPTEYGNSLEWNENEKKTLERDGEKIFSKEVKNDFIQNTEESVRSVDTVNGTRSNGYESFPQEKEKNLTVNNKLHEVVIPKVDPQSRAEILELFSSGSSAERLERLLASRNMTIEELIALRQRGSSQVHFAEVFKAKERTSPSLGQNTKTNLQISEDNKPIKNNETNERTENVFGLKKNTSKPSDIEDNENLRISKNVSRNKKKDIYETDTEYFATDLFKLFSENKNTKNNSSTVDKPYKNLDTHVMNSGIKSRTGMDLRKVMGNSDLATMLKEIPVGNNIQKDSDGSSYYTSIEAVELPVQEKGEEVKEIPDIFGGKRIGIMNSVNLEEIGRVEEILNNDLKSIKSVYGTNDYEFSEKKALSKVKPSIIASGGILGVTIVVFLSIFITCRIQQKKKFAYKNSFAKAVFHNPVMTARKLSNTSSVNTIMVDVVATSTTKRPQKHDIYESDGFESKSDIDNDSLDANDSWDTIPDFMK